MFINLIKKFSVLMIFLTISVSFFENILKAKDNFILLYGAKYIDKRGVVLQRYENDCGVASLKMVFNYFNQNIGLEEISKKILTKDGTNMLKMKKLAEEKGLKVYACNIEMNDLKKVKYIAILHFKNNHFVVLDKIENKNIFILDPAVGRLSVYLGKFIKIWSGNILIFTHK